MEYSPLIALVFVLAGACKGLIGLGLPTVSIGLLALVMPPAEAAALLLLPSVVTNITQCAGRELPVLLRRLWPMLVALLPGVLLGSQVIAAGSAALPWLGLALLAYAGWGLAAPNFRLSPQLERASSVPVGLLGGVVTGATGVFVIPVAAWLGALGLSRDALVQALGLFFLAATLALGVALAWQGQVTASLAGGSALALVPALLGQWLGTRLRAFVPAPVFKRLFFGALLLLGLQLAWRGLA